MASGDIRIGVSGWRYPPWRGDFYPQGLAQKNELAFIGEAFPAVEINGTFYSLKRPENFEKWADEVPGDFVFAVKGSRFITHMKQLRDIEAPLGNFFAQGVLGLGKKLGPFLWQFSPRFRFDPERMEDFLALLPHDTDAASQLARKHDARVAGRARLKAPTPMKLRHAVEIRHQSFVDPAFVRLLRRHRIALVCADTVDWPRLMDVTSDFVYCRLHGSEELYASGYGDDELDIWAARVKAWARGSEPKDAERIIDKAGPRRAKRDVFVFFDNDRKVRAPYDARALISKTGVSQTR
jgi:uncharacterized protein YecE (DUF72 family)